MTSAKDHVRAARQGRRYGKVVVEGETSSRGNTLPNTPPTLLSARLRQLRVDAGMTQSDLATRLSTLGNRVSDWECGIVIPTLTILNRYAKTCDTTVSEILDGVM